MIRKYHFTRDSRKRLTDFASDREAAVPAKEDTGAVLIEYGATHVGKVRAKNQDVLLEAEEIGLYGVADGMGGHNGGEMASAGARDELLRALQGQKPSLDALRSAFEAANTAIYRQQQEDEKLSGMGTTLSVLWMSEFFVYIGHVGDSRIYCLREGKLQQMTDDHSLVAELVRLGYLTPEQAENHPNRNVITRAVGTEEKIDVDLAVEERRSGDIWLVCSDGLHGCVSDAEMEAALKENEPKEAVNRLLQAALDAGGRDNISVIVLCDGEAAR